MRPVRHAFPIRPGRALAIGASLAALAACTGCVRREIEVTSTPPGALITVNGRDIGRTPARMRFTFDGTYDVRLRLAGYESVTGKGTTDMPVWDFMGADLVAEMAPADIHRLERWHFDLVPEADAAVGLRDRADAARRDAESMPSQVPDALSPTPTATPEGARRGG
ncbi:MAG: PEGA domain-containing protein [Planctomycetota bacterium]